MTLDAAIRAKAARVRLLGLDVDGVLTDGRLFYGQGGELLKCFHTRDGLGLKLLAREGVKIVVISGRQSSALERRLSELGLLADAFLGTEAKGERMAEALAAHGVPPEEAAFVGDDLPDLLAMRTVGLAVAVRDAHPRVRAAADWVTEARGGEGAVREVCDALLEARGRLDAAVAAYLGEGGG